MARFSMSKSEFKYYLEMLQESGELIGVDAEIRICLHENQDIYNDPAPSYSEPYQGFLFWENNPKPVLNRYKWLKEGEDMPYVAYIVRFDKDGNDLKLTRYSTIKIQSELTQVVEDEYFEVANLRGSSERPFMFVASLNPYRFQTDMLPTTPGVEPTLNQDSPTLGYNYFLGRPDRRDS